MKEKVNKLIREIIDEGYVIEVVPIDGGTMFSIHKGVGGECIGRSKAEGKGLVLFFESMLNNIRL